MTQHSYQKRQNPLISSCVTTTRPALVSRSNRRSLVNHSSEHSPLLSRINEKKVQTHQMLHQSNIENGCVSKVLIVSLALGKYMQGGRSVPRKGNWSGCGERTQNPAHMWLMLHTHPAPKPQKSPTAKKSVQVVPLHGKSKHAKADARL